MNGSVDYKRISGGSGGKSENDSDADSAVKESIN